MQCVSHGRTFPVSQKSRWRCRALLTNFKITFSKNTFPFSRCKGEKTEMKHSDKITRLFRSHVRNADKRTNAGVHHILARSSGRSPKSRGSYPSFLHLFIHPFRFLNLAFERGKNVMHVRIPDALVLLRTVVVQHKHDVKVNAERIIHV